VHAGKTARSRLLPPNFSAFILNGDTGRSSNSKNDHHQHRYLLHIASPKKDIELLSVNTRGQTIFSASTKEEEEWL
jgi:hypothetical protein